MMNKPQQYIGVDKDINGGMTNIGKIIHDAQVFELISDHETCEGWDLSRINALLQQVNTEWDKYGCLVSLLPVYFRQRHDQIHGQALKQAKQAGWSGEIETGDEE